MEVEMRRIGRRRRRKRRRRWYTWLPVFEHHKKSVRGLE
jgi:hypothetical protein